MPPCLGNAFKNYNVLTLAKDLHYSTNKLSVFCIRFFKNIRYFSIQILSIIRKFILCKDDILFNLIRMHRYCKSIPKGMKQNSLFKLKLYHVKFFYITMYSSMPKKLTQYFASMISLDQDFESLTIHYFVLF